MNQISLPQSASEPTFLFCGGGSGGHLYPAIAVCEELEARLQGQCRCVFLTTGKSIEEKVLDRQFYETISLPAVSSQDLRRRPIRSSLAFMRSLFGAGQILKQYNPSIVIGLGGYGSLPGVMVARISSIPCLLMEQNSLPGKANELLSRSANVVCTSYPNEFRNPSTSVRFLQTGNPVRKAIRELQVYSANVRVSQKTLTVLGGSQGASALNFAMQSIVQSHPEIFQNWQVIHQTGQEDNSELIKTYRHNGIQAKVAEYFDDMTAIYQRTTLVLSRAGATTLAELAVLGIPAILVPYPNSVRDHQLKNAEIYENQNAAIIVQQTVDQEQFAADCFTSLQQLLTTPDRIEVMSAAMKQINPANAAANVADEIMKLI